MNNKLTFENADAAYKYLYDTVCSEGVDFDGTKALFNVGFTLQNPLDNHITDVDRAWKYSYAEAEWKWYLSGNRNVGKLGLIYGLVPKIWKMMANDKGDVNSNYGWQWQRSNQLDYVVDLLKNNPNTRKAAISIYDAKEHSTYSKDTPCTYAIQFTILNGRLNMSVMMRSNDVWFGFCNDQYCFSELMCLVAKQLDIPVGEYFHFAHNMHVYNHQLKK